MDSGNRTKLLYLAILWVPLLLVLSARSADAQAGGGNPDQGQHLYIHWLSGSKEDAEKLDHEFYLNSTSAVPD